MKIWDRIEQLFKQEHLRLFERALGRAVVPASAVDPEQIRSILVVRQHDQLGDFLLSIPALRALRNRFAQARIGLVVRGYTEPVARHSRYVDELFVVHEALNQWKLSHISDFARRLLRGWDLAIVLNTVSHSLTSDLLARFSAATWTLGSEHKRFPGTKRNFFYNILAPYQSGVRHQSQRNVDIVRVIGADTADLHEEMTLLPAELRAMRRRLSTDGIGDDEAFLLVHPGAGKRNNRWPPERFGEAAWRLSREFALRVVVTWGPGEDELGSRVLSRFKGAAVTVTGLQIRKLAALSALAELLLCNDTGSMHVGAAVGTPLVAVFGPTDPREWKPWGDDFIAVRGADGRCESVQVDEVVQRARSLLERGSPTVQ